MVVVVEAFDGRILDGAVHSLDLTVGPRMAGFGQTMLDIEISASHLEGMATKRHFVLAHGFDVIRRPAIAGWVGEMSAVVGQHGMDFVRHSYSKRTKEVSGDAPGCFLNQLGEGEFGRPINGHEEIKLAFRRMHLRNVNVKVADRIALELLLRLLVAFDTRQP